MTMVTITKDKNYNILYELYRIYTIYYRRIRDNSKNDANPKLSLTPHKQPWQSQSFVIQDTVLSRKAKKMNTLF